MDCYFHMEQSMNFRLQIEEDGHIELSFSSLECIDNLRIMECKKNDRNIDGCNYYDNISFSFLYNRCVVRASKQTVEKNSFYFYKIYVFI